MGEQSILEYRLTSLEDKFESLTRDISSKLDDIIKGIGHLDKSRDIAVLGQKALEERVAKIEIRQSESDNKIVSLQISLAEKIGPGALAGGIISGLIALIQHLVGA